MYPCISVAAAFVYVCTLFVWFIQHVNMYECIYIHKAKCKLYCQTRQMFLSLYLIFCLYHFMTANSVMWQ